MTTMKSKDYYELYDGDIVKVTSNKKPINVFLEHTETKELIIISDGICENLGDAEEKYVLKLEANENGKFYVRVDTIETVAIKNKVKIEILRKQQNTWRYYIDIPYYKKGGYLKNFHNKELFTKY